MIINDKILSIPPFISTSWHNVNSMHMKGTSLIISLADGEIVTINNLPIETIEMAFSYHAKFLERETMIESQSESKGLAIPPLKFPFLGQNEGPLKIGFAALDNFGTTLSHNPQLANAPDMPSDLLQKIGSIAKIVVDDPHLLPKPEKDCNCPNCQLARAIHGIPKNSMEEEEIISTEELKFQDWDIDPAGNELYNVTNRLDENEKYVVFLGAPKVGCTCGKPACEHIKAVLRS